MKNQYSTFATLFVSNPAEAMVFDRWLEDRNFDLQRREELIHAVADDVVVDRCRLAEVVGEYDAGIRPGQVRILSKRFTGSPEVVPFVAVLEKWDADMWLIAPFSPYTQPATPGEMAIGAQPAGLRVIQAWNGRTVFGELLEKSFLFGELDEDRRKEALALFRNQLAGTELPVGFSAKRGPAILYEADPRREYVAEAIARLSPLSTAVKATERFKAEAAERKIEQQRLLDELAKRGDIFAPDIESREAERKAAGKHQPIVMTYEVGDNQLDMEYSPEDGAVNLTFYGKDDEKTTDCDGFGVFGKGLEFIGVFRQGTFTSSRERLGKVFEITDREGRRVAKPRLVDDGMKLL